jgi:hypothetical protein
VVVLAESDGVAAVAAPLSSVAVDADVSAEVFVPSSLLAVVEPVPLESVDEVVAVDDVVAVVAFDEVEDAGVEVAR